MSPITLFICLGVPAFTEIKVEILPSSGKTARNDLRFGIVNGATDQMIAAIFERDHIAVGRFPENLEHLAGINPVVPMQNSRSRFDDNSRHAAK